MATQNIAATRLAIPSETTHISTSNSIAIKRLNCKSASFLIFYISTTAAATVSGSVSFLRFRPIRRSTGPPPTALSPRREALKSIYSSRYPLRLFRPVARLHARSQNLIFRAVPGSARGAEDADLIARVRKGDVEGFNLLISRWEKRVFNYLLRLTGNPDDSMDLSQDVFLKAYQNIRKLDDTARFGPWLFRIAHNEAYSGFRKKRPEVAAPEFETQGSETKDSFFDRQIAPGIAVDLSLAISGLLDRLSPEQREAVVLKIYQGFKFDEMAEILECPVSTIKSRLYTALELLKTELAPANTRGIR
jgi:RNA polymerase sigma-70 factor (ECF subfamily)